MRIAMRRADIKWVRFLVYTPDGQKTDIDFSNIYFTVKKTFNDHQPLFQKTLKDGLIHKLDAGDYLFKIEPADTELLVIGNYVFDIQIMYKSIIKESFVGNFVVKEEVTFSENESNDVSEIDYTIPQVGDDSSLVLEIPDYHILQLETPAPVHEDPGDYNSLTNKPQINGTTIEGNLTSDDLGIPSAPLSADDIDAIIDEVDAGQ